MIGLGVQGDIMVTSFLTVTVTSQSAYGTTPNLTGLAPSNSAIAYSPSGEAGNVVGALSCSTTATNSSNVGTYPISACSGLSDPGYTVIYDYADSSHTVVKADQTILITTHAPASAAYGTHFTVAATGGGSANPVTYGSSGSCTNTGADFTMTSGTGTCTVTYDQAGSSNYNAAPQKTEIRHRPEGRPDDPDHDPRAVECRLRDGLHGRRHGRRLGEPGHVRVVGRVHECRRRLHDDERQHRCTVTYDQAGNANYKSAPQATETVTAQKADQTITFASRRTARTATRLRSGRDVVVRQRRVVRRVRGLLDRQRKGPPHRRGPCHVTADQAGDANYNAAPSVMRTFSIAKAALSITANDQQKYFDQPLVGSSAFSSSGLVGSDSVSGVTLSSAGAAASAATGTYTIVPSNAVAGPSTDLGNYTITYHNGTLHVLPVGIIGLHGVSVTASGGHIDSYDSTHGAYGSSNRGSTARRDQQRAGLASAGSRSIGSAISTQGSVSVAQSAKVTGDVIAGTTASIAGTVGGTVTQHSPSTALATPTVATCSPYSPKPGLSGGDHTYSASGGDLLVKGRHRQARAPARTASTTSRSGAERC